jgi:hypothetical protein
VIEGVGKAQEDTKIGGLIKSLATPEGRNRLRAAEEAAAAPAKVVVDAVMLAPPVECLGAGEWRIKGVYEHQVLKAGLRQLDHRWPVDTLMDFAPGLFREKLIREIMLETITLQSVPTGDVSAAQRDLHFLSLRQLLRLRVLHIDFTPSGCGADSISRVGETHEAFLSTLDSLLFKQLGRKAAAAEMDGAVGVSDLHRLGRDAVFLAAASAAVGTPPWWVWWITDERRIFFHAERFEISEAFPEADGGALEITDYSRPDAHDPSGRLRWFDWRLCSVTDDTKLSEAPKKGDDDASREWTTPRKRDDTCADGSGGSADSSPNRSPKKAPSCGAATAGMVNTNVLQDMRNALKKTPPKKSNRST